MTIVQYTIRHVTNSPTKRRSARASWKRACSRAARAAALPALRPRARRRASRVMMYQDHDGNIVHHFNIPGTALAADGTAEALVECAAPPPLPDALRADAWDAARCADGVGRVLGLPAPEPRSRDRRRCSSTGATSWRSTRGDDPLALLRRAHARHLRARSSTARRARASIRRSTMR